jgi:hypothetical protein
LVRSRGVLAAAALEAAVVAPAAVLPLVAPPLAAAALVAALVVAKAFPRGGERVAGIDRSARPAARHTVVALSQGQ